MAPQVGLEPTTLRLTAACSASWAIEERQEGTLAYTFAPSHNLGDYLSSPTVSHKVFSAVWSLTTVFEMGTGVSFIQ